ncbi:unnamed protein product [Meganyctiphanes norvegica]|uniref:Sulfotransferase domain-containing protein n=1 Tax=Meganyctiphanes norvegica TaxID=48144 RepID=A0AAV2QEL5_MEGNR
MSSMKLSSGHTVEAVEDEELEELKRLFPGPITKNSLIRLQPNGWFFPSDYLTFCDKLYNFKLYPTDVIVMTFAKCGTTWTQELVWTLRNNPDLNNPLADKPLGERTPFFEADSLMYSRLVDTMATEGTHPQVELLSQVNPGADWRNGVNWQLAEALQHPRTIKTHLPLELMPNDLLKTTKVVYVCRNPRDCILSWLHHNRLFKGTDFTGTLDQFIDIFIKEKWLHAPYSTHINTAWKVRDNPNLLFLFYEDLKADILGQLKRVDNFLGTNRTEEQLKNVASHSSFPEMRKRSYESEGLKVGEAKDRYNKEVHDKEGGFFRKGVTGDWKEKFTPAQIAIIDQYVQDNLPEIPFKYSV